MNRSRRGSLLVAVVFLVSAYPSAAQVVPWLESPFLAKALAKPATTAEASESPSPAVKSVSTKPERDRRRRAPANSRVVVAPESDAGDPTQSVSVFSFSASAPATLVISNFSGATSDGRVRTDSTWNGQVVQQSETLLVAGTARDDNGWGATHVSLDASGMSYLNIVAQRNAGHAASTLSIQFEDYSLQTKVVSVSTSQFALGSMTLVQVPLTGWTIDFGPSQITSWSLGGGSVGTVDFRMTFDSLSFTTTAIPEPATYAALAGLAALTLAARRRRR